MTQKQKYFIWCPANYQKTECHNAKAEQYAIKSVKLITFDLQRLLSCYHPCYNFIKLLLQACYTIVTPLARSLLKFAALFLLLITPLFRPFLIPLLHFRNSPNCTFFTPLSYQFYQTYNQNYSFP